MKLSASKTNDFDLTGLTSDELSMIRYCVRYYYDWEISQARLDDKLNGTSRAADIEDYREFSDRIEAAIKEWLNRGIQASVAQRTERP